MLGRMVWGFPGNHACHGHFHGLRRGAFLHDGFAAIEGNYENVRGAGSSLGGGVNESEGGEKERVDMGSLERVGSAHRMPQSTTRKVKEYGFTQICHGYGLLLRGFARDPRSNKWAVAPR